jgi:hypothetical protein
VSSSSLNFLKYYKIRVTAKVAPSSISFFFFKKVEFTASSILSPEDPGKVAAEYEGRNVTFSDLQSLVKKINLLYKSKSSVISEAEIPAQDDVSSGVIKILLVERRIGHYHIKGNESTKSNCILPWIHDPEGGCWMRSLWIRISSNSTVSAMSNCERNCNRVRHLVLQMST